MNSARILRNNDLCERRAWYSLRWKPPFLSPRAILIDAVEHGLCSTGEPGEAAEAKAMDLAVNPGIDTAETDMLGLAQHVASLANFLAWLLRGSQMPYKRPEPISLPDGTLWTSGAFLSPTETHLRRVVLVDRWDSWAQLSLERSWDVAGECAVYGVGMDCVVVEIGALRNGRWSNPFTCGLRHPVSKTLRFKKRDGDDFGSTWVRVEREKDSATREEWLDAMADDGVLADLIHVHTVAPERIGAILHLAESKLARIGEAGEPPENLSICFSRVNPCPFRSCCPRALEPGPETGFVPRTSLP